TKVHARPALQARDQIARGARPLRQSPCQRTQRTNIFVVPTEVTSMCPWTKATYHANLVSLICGAYVQKNAGGVPGKMSPLIGTSGGYVFVRSTMLSSSAGPGSLQPVPSAEQYAGPSFQGFICSDATLCCHVNPVVASLTSPRPAG